ncbi:MAG: RHS repeat protein [Flavobacteriales bacterium]|nr:RHS repeat protein [Flavobacteriales bacterium]
MIRSFLLSVAFGLVLCAQAQVLLVQPSLEDPDAIHFNPAFIARNRVASVIGENMVKPDGRPMSTEAAKVLYRFDAQGRTVYANNSFGQPGTGRDTTSTTFTFDPLGRETERLRNDLAGHFLLRIEYDSLDRPVRETYCRIENLSTDRYDLVRGPSIEISDERFTYAQPNDTVTRKTYLNNLGLPYREQTLVYDHMGYLLQMEDRYLISERRARTRFAYDEHGRLKERVDQRDITRPETVRRTYAYDAAGNVLSSDAWHGDRLRYHEEYLYEEGSSLLKARLRKDSDTGHIHVIRYRTEFR